MFSQGKKTPSDMARNRPPIKKIPVKSLMVFSSLVLGLAAPPQVSGQAPVKIPDTALCRWRRLVDERLSDLGEDQAGKLCKTLYTWTSQRPCV
jgi:hypothetical protein